MKMTRKRLQALAPLVIAVVAASIALALGAAEARATDGGTSSMPGMSAEEMQNMGAPTPAPTATVRQRSWTRTWMWPAARQTGSWWAASWL